MLRTDREPEYRRRIREKAEKYDKESNDKRNFADKVSNIHEIVLAIQTINRNYEYERRKEHTRKKWDRFWEVAGAAGLWIAAAVGIAAIWVGTHDASEQRDVLQKTLVMSERPWLYPNGRLVTVSTVGTPIAARFTGPLINLGKAIATKIQASGHFVIRTQAIGVPETQIDYRTIPCSVKNAPFGPPAQQIAIPPGKEGNIFIDIKQPGKIGDLLPGKYNRPFLLGCIQYRWPFTDEIFHTYFYVEINIMDQDTGQPAYFEFPKDFGGLRAAGDITYIHAD